SGRWEGGTLNIPGIVALGASLELLLEMGGPGALEKRILELTDRLCEGMRRIGWQVHGRRLPGDRSGIVSLIPRPGLEPGNVVRQARTAGVVISRRAGRVRVSPHAYNTENEVDHLVSLLGGLS